MRKGEIIITNNQKNNNLIVDIKGKIHTPARSVIWDILLENVTYIHLKIFKYHVV